MTIDEKLQGKDLYDFLVQNKNVLIAEKKFGVKFSDSIMSAYAVDREGHVIKSVTNKDNDNGVLNASLAINSCLFMDSHKDVHIPGIWKKSLSESKSLYLLQEHSMTFKGIVTDDVKAYTKMVAWKKLGFDIEGETEVLVFDVKISKTRNEFMYEQYKQGWVKNHSVGMQYVKIEMAINDEDYKEEYAVWNKYIDRIANKEQAEKTGYFFPVTEAKVIEGSGCVVGSNPMTPTLEVKCDTQQPPVGTVFEPSGLDMNKLINIFKN